MALDVAELKTAPPLSPSPRSQPTHSIQTSTSKFFHTKSTSSPDEDSTFVTSSDSTSTNGISSGSVSVLSWTSLSSFHSSLPEPPRIYDFSEIYAATNNFLSKQFSTVSSTPSWRCMLRGKDVVIFQRKFQRKMELKELKDRFYKICRSHHTSIIKLLGASVSGECLYLVYDFVNGANLVDCLRNSKNPNFTILSTWISRMQVATDLAHGLDYIHNKSGLNMSLTHNHIKSSGIVVTEPSFHAKICHFGAAQLCNEIDGNKEVENGKTTAEYSKMKSPSKPRKWQKSESQKIQIKGVRGYMAPEYKSSGVATQMTDVYAFGVVMLELLSGEEPLKFKFDRSTGDFVRVSLIETAMAVIEEDDDEEPRMSEISSGGVEGRLRKWVDHRLKDSFPIHVAEKITRLAVQCVDVDPTKRPNMARVASKISKLYLESRIWSDSMAIPANMSVSLAPR